MGDAVWKPLLRKLFDAEASAFAESNFAGNLGEWLRDPVPLVEGIWPAAVKGVFYPCCRFLLDGGKTNRLWFQHSQLVFFSISSFAFNCTEIEERGCSRGAAGVLHHELSRAIRDRQASAAGGERGGGFWVREGSGSHPTAQPHCRTKLLGWSEGKMDVMLLSFCTRFHSTL